jgi:Domain of unknown function (DUF4129)
MSRWWTEHAAAVDDAVGLGLATLLLLLAAGLVAAAWYWFPAWLPWRWWPARRTRSRARWRWPWQWSWRWPRWPWRRRRARPADEPAPGLVEAGGDDLPDLPAAAFLSLADRYAAEGRYAEAVRERLRAIVRELVDAGAIENRPGWTVTELARAAGVARPPVARPVSGASALFSDIWYGQRPADRSHDGQMRGYAGEVHEHLRRAPAGSPA